eukprot:SAG11_NODE_213_length_12262_cov_8.391597_12_plen_111_part_00
MQNLTIIGSLAGSGELHFVKSLLPEGSRELEAMTRQREHFGVEWASAAMTLKDGRGGDLLTETTLAQIAGFEDKLLTMVAKDPDDGHLITVRILLTALAFSLSKRIFEIR